MSGILPPSISRRRFFGSAAAAVVAACSRADPATKPETSTEGIPVAPLTSDPFLLGVASGDPTDTSVILWTRLAPDGARLETNVDVTWIVADDPGLDSVVATGVLRASAEFAHSVHVDVTGLQPGHLVPLRIRGRGLHQHNWPHANIPRCGHFESSSAVRVLVMPKLGGRSLWRPPPRCCRRPRRVHLARRLHLRIGPRHVWCSLPRRTRGGYLVRLSGPLCAVSQ